MKKVFTGVLAAAVALVVLNGRFDYRWHNALAQATAVPSCVFAGYDQHGSLNNTGITCVTPAASGAPQGIPTGGNCIAVSTPPAPGSIAAVLPSPTSTSTAGAPSVSWSTAPGSCTLAVNFPATVAQTTPSPSATSTSTAGVPACIWSGSYPYTLGCSFPAAGVGVLVTSSPGPINVATPTSGTFVVGCNGCTQRTSGAAGSYDALILSEASTTHFYPMNDAAPCNTAADAIAGGATALPSPQPMTTPTAGTGTLPVCGQPSLSGDGEASWQFPNGGNIGYLRAPQGVFRSSPFTYELLYKHAAQASAGICVKNFIFDEDSNTSQTDFNFDIEASATNVCSHKYYVPGSNVGAFDQITQAATTLLDVTFDGTTVKVYANCDLLTTSTGSTPAPVSTSAGAIGAATDSGGVFNPFLGRISKFSVHNVALSQTVICSHAASLGL